jgi:hypothetical protein
VASPSLIYSPYSDGVAANNATSYSLLSGTLPTGLSLNTSSGAITGTPTDQGNFSFVVRASGSGGSTDTPSLSIQIIPPGKRFTDGSTSTNLTTIQRFDGNQWVDATTMKRFDGTSWVDITNT